MDLYLITKIKFKSINNVYQFILNIFDNNNVLIKNIILDKEIILLMKFGENKLFELALAYQQDYNIDIFNIDRIKQIQNEINILKKENNMFRNEIKKLNEEKKELRNEINKLKQFHEKTKPQNIKFLKNIVEDSYAWPTNAENTFVVFKSINNILYLIYSNKNNSFICYDLDNSKKIKEINENIHVYVFRHNFDEKNKRDLIMNIYNDFNIKIWNANNWECILNLTNIYNSGEILSACFLNKDNEILIMTSNRQIGFSSESIKSYNFKGEKIKELNNSDEMTFFIDSYYDNILSKIYIITGNYGYVKSYDYDKNELYFKYKDKFLNLFDSHFSIVINNKNDIIQLIESSCDGNIRIWNFHTGLLLKRIKVSDNYLHGICLWDNNYIFVGCQDKTMKLIELNTGLISKTLEDYHHNVVLTIKKIYHPKYGDCILSQGHDNSHIKLWIFN